MTNRYTRMLHHWQIQFWWTVNILFTPNRMRWKNVKIMTKKMNYEVPPILDVRDYAPSCSICRCGCIGELTTTPSRHTHTLTRKYSNLPKKETARWMSHSQKENDCTFFDLCNLRNGISLNYYFDTTKTATTQQFSRSGSNVPTNCLDGFTTEREYAYVCVCVWRKADS